MAQICRVRPE